MEMVINLPLSVFVNQGFSQYRGPERSESHSLGYYEYLILSNALLKDAIAFVCGDSLTAVGYTGAEWETAKVVEGHDQDCDEVESE